MASKSKDGGETSFRFGGDQGERGGASCRVPGEADEEEGPRTDEDETRRAEAEDDTRRYTPYRRSYY